MTREVRIALSTDANGHPYHATLIASILRRTSLPVHVRCWCRGFLPESFESGRLKVEFLAAVEEVTGTYPGNSGPSAYDRLLVIRDCPDWDRCMVMDYDQLVLCDMGPLFDMDLGDHLLAAHMQGPGVDMGYAMRVWLKRPIPAGWEHVTSHPYFLMPPLLNLKAMREAGTWEMFLNAHAAFGADEQLSLTAATEGRSLPLDRKWNLFPRLHIPDGVVPEGIIHWSGWPKPWHKGAKVWRPDIWESEKSSWEHLRMGIWEKPLAIEIEPDDERDIAALGRRGWKVRVFSNESSLKNGDHRRPLEFPDVTFEGGNTEAFQEVLGREANGIDRVRIGPWAELADWLEGSANLPEYLVVSGKRLSCELEALRGAGYSEEICLKPSEWPAGGPLPRVLDFIATRAGHGTSAGEEVYLKISAAGRSDPAAHVYPRSQRHARADNPAKIGVVVFAFGVECPRVPPLLASLRRNFLPDQDVTLLLFTDGDFSHAPDLRVIKVSPDPFEDSALRKSRLLSSHEDILSGMDYLYQLDVDTRVIDHVGTEILGDLVAVIHPGFHDKPRSRFTYEHRPDSAARVKPEEGTHYFCGAFHGGKARRYLDAVHSVAGGMEQDASRGLTAVWRDESHWNRHLIDQPPTLVLSPSYCWYPDGRTKDFQGRIELRSKPVPDPARR